MGSRACQSSPMGNMDYRQPSVGSNPYEYYTRHRLYSQPFQVEHQRGKQMNIKLKAWLITLAIPVLVAILTVLIARFPLVILLVLVGGALYLLYSGILNYLEFKENRNQ